MTTNIKKKPQPYQVRRIAYGLAAVVVGVLGWVGVLSDIQADQVTGQIDKWLPILLGVLAPALAAAKTHPGSDSTATDADVEAASAIDVDDVAAQIASRLRDEGEAAGKHAADAAFSYIRNIRGE
ncbi:hypothetical protein ACTXK0_05185 [Corynebacterium variabile]|uniref:hypothetical protein n=1 Tax=Corynebacterium variabile TaxID=1727 RepID=UPI003FD1947B